jgi:hypothetical protein
VICTVVGLAIQLPDWTTRWTVLRRWCFIMGWLYLFRSVTIVVTTLPSPLKDGCVPPSLSLHGTAGQRFGAFFETVAGNDQSCGDNIFSGHTCVMTSCALAWRIHSRAHRFYGWVLYLIATAGILMIIFTHYHYTIDVLLALCKLTFFFLMAMFDPEQTDSCIDACAQLLCMFHGTFI